MRKLVLLWTVVWLGIGLTGQTAEGEKYPQPKTAELSRAEKLVDEVFGKDMAKARSAQEKAKLALEMLRMAAEDKDQANRYVLAKKAKELAVQAMDSKLAISALDVLIEFEAKDMPESPEEAAKRGHALWNESVLLQGQARLAKRIEAAEWYLRTLDRIGGLDQSIAKVRLKELGWGNYVFAFEFEKDTEGWQPVQAISNLGIQDGCLVGAFTDIDPFLIVKNLSIDGKQCSHIEIRMALTDGEYIEFFWSVSPPRWMDGWKVFVPVKSDGQFHTYSIPVYKFPTWRNNTITALRLDPGDHWKIKTGVFKIDYIRGVNK